MESMNLLTPSSIHELINICKFVNFKYFKEENVLFDSKYFNLLFYKLLLIFFLRKKWSKALIKPLKALKITKKTKIYLKEI